MRGYCIPCLYSLSAAGGYFTPPAAQCLDANNLNFISNSTISAGTINSTNWSFGDGNSGTGTSVSHSYASAGSYNAELIVVSDHGCADTVAHPVIIHPKPAAQFIAPSAQCLTGNNFNLISTSTIGSGNITDFNWDFGDGSTATGQSVSHSYAAEGSYHVKLITISDHGCIDSVIHDITVYPKPKAIFTDPVAQCFNGNKFDFSVPTLLNTNPSLTTWKFGDGAIAYGPWHNIATKARGYMM